MGTLYYLRKDSGESFALNKARYFDDIPGHDWKRFSLPADPEDFKRQYLAAADPAWAAKVADRIYRWAKNDALHLTMDCAGEEDVPHEEEITGSPYDEDHDAEGNYIPGSAW